MHAFVRNLITEWRLLGLPTTGGTVVVAVSGGADSVSLLMAVHEMRKSKKHDLRIVAAHFNHRLRGAESDADEEYVRQLASEHGIELVVDRGDIDNDGNLEQNARRARYTFLTETAEELRAFAVLAGHTVNDQAETFLMNLIRGSGVDGLAGMKPIRKLADHGSPVLLVRPLLKWANRGQTEQYCHDIGVGYRHDTMNEDTAFKRVRIRKVLLPLLADLNPNIIETLANTAELMQHASLQQIVANDRILADELDLKHLRNLGQAELYGTLRDWLTGKRGTKRQIGLKHIQAVGRLVLSEKSGRAVELPGGGTVFRSGGKLSFG